MTKREYLKYNRDDVYDMLDNQINVGDIVIFNTYCRSQPYIGIVDHFCESGRLAIRYTYTYGSLKKMRYKVWAYRYPNNVIKFKNGNKSKYKNKSKGKS